MISLEQSDIVNDLAVWIVGMLDPGADWRGAWAEFKPTPDKVWVQLHSEAESGVSDFAGDIKQGSDADPAVRRLQEVCYNPGVGAWVSALIEVRPNGPSTFAPRATFNYDKDPGAIAGDDGPLSPEQLVDHLQRFPRRAEHVPDWMAHRIEQGGLRVPVQQP